MRILYVTTTFPVYSETFLQREARAMREAGEELRIVSLHRGDRSWEGMPVCRFNKIRLARLLWILPWALLKKRRDVDCILKAMTSEKPPFWLSFWENLLGFGAALADCGAVERWRPDVIHGVWASAPAAYAWMLSRLCGIPFTMGAHAYDIFERGGDWMLRAKLESACLVQTSTEAGRERLRELVDPAKIRMIRRGLDRLPPYREPRKQMPTMRIACVARLVEKKGFPRQIEIYRALRNAGIAFEAQVLGDGPMREWIEGELSRLGLSGSVRLRGRVPIEEVWRTLSATDLLLHTGIVSASGDRDGLPNVVPEAMAAGAIVVGSPVSGVVEAIEDGVTGFLREPADAGSWVELVARLKEDGELRRGVAARARQWVEGNFVASRNTGRWLSETRSALGLQEDRRAH